MPVSLAVQREVEVTMRTAPVVLLTQAAIVLVTGAAIAAVPMKSEDTTTVRDFQAFMIDLLGAFLGKLPAFVLSCTRKSLHKSRIIPARKHYSFGPRRCLAVAAADAADSAGRADGRGLITRIPGLLRNTFSDSVKSTTYKRWICAEFS
jgi:hypothetical protein